MSEIGQVFVVRSGYENEGSDIESIHKTFEGALKAVTELINSQESKNWKLVGINEWSCFGEYITIETFDVLD